MAIRINFRRIAKSSVPVACYTLFAVLLTFYLFEKPVPLGNLQHLGWQAFDIVSFANVTAGSGSKGAEVPPQSETDWWDVGTGTEEAVGPTSFRLDVWNPLTPHRTGCTYEFLPACVCLSLRMCCMRYHSDGNRSQALPLPTGSLPLL